MRINKNTFEQCKAAAAGCTSRSAFRRKAPREYDTAWDQGWLDQICPKGISPDQTPWTKERVAEVAKLYASRRAMKASRHQIAYKRAMAKGWQDALPPIVSTHNSDNDSVYLWQAAELTYNGLPVYKIGVTSTRLGAQRIQRVAEEARLTAKIIFNRWVPDARALEKRLLAFGQDPLYCDFDGASEFRALTAADVAAMQSLVDSQAIL